MAETQRLITGPYGHGQGYGISLTCTIRVLEWEALDKLLEKYSCHRPAVAKVRSCLEHSGRYDCVVQSIWFKHQYIELKSELLALGITLRVTSQPRGR